MAESIVERYQRILRADPASRVFVELARALVERGEAESAVEICARGVQHHPDSVVARIVWGKALLALGRADEATARFDEATLIDPASPYAYDLAGEALVLGGYPARALALLERGAEHHPRDPRLQHWQSRAMEIVARGEPEPTPTSGPPPIVPRASPSPPPLPKPVATAPAPPSLGVDDAPAGAPGAVDGDESSAGEISQEAAAAAFDDDEAPGREAAPVGAVDPQDEPGVGDEVVPAGPEDETSVSPPTPPSPVPFTKAARQFVRRHLRAAALITLVLAGSAGAATFVVVHDRQRVSEARSATAAARAGLARDTLGSLRQAARALDEALRLAPRDADAAALHAEVSALLAHDFEDGGARDAARGALTSNAAGRGTYAARWLLAAGAERDDATAPLLANRTATPLASAVAGELLVTLGDLDAARAALLQAAQGRPPMLRAIVSLGDLDLAAGEVAAARERYQAVLAVQATHPRAALGLADASLASGQDLAPALKTLEAVAADRESTVPARDRVRFDLVHARLLAANGRAAEALPILDEASARHPGPEVVATRAAVLAASGDLDGAVAAARIAVDRSRGEARFRELVAQLQLRQGRYRALLATSAREPSRTLLVYRGIARLSLGDVPGARTELEATRRDRKMTPEAAAWAALVEIAAGRTVAVAGVVDALLEQPNPHPAALLARGRLDVAAGRRPSAEQRLREAIERDPDLVEASTALSDLLVETGRAPEALELMKATLRRSPGRGVGRVALARALIAAGRPDDALGELTAVLANAPEDPPAEEAARQLLRAIRRPGRRR